MEADIAIVDYGMGNIRSVQNSIHHLGFKSNVVADPQELHGYRKIILPGVGAFGQAINCLNNSGMAEALNMQRQAEAHILGICLGMQLMCSISGEDGSHEGLNWFSAKVLEFSSLDLVVPHMGWDSVDFVREDAILDDLQSGGDAYFVHGFYVQCSDFSDVLATTNYGREFHSMIKRENLYGIQFHPEKSQDFGLKIIDNFIKIPC
jgi:glutamine amidotransferase